MSPEDIWPRWLSTMFREVHGTKVFHQTLLDEETGTHERRSAQRLTIQAPVVCRPCNNNWMSRAEKAVKPILSSLITKPSTQQILTRKERETLAMWTAIKAVVLDHRSVGKHVQPTPFFSPQQRTAMRTLERPPNRISVYVGRIPSPAPGTTRGNHKTVYYSKFPGRANKHLRAFAVTIAANEFVIQLIASKMRKALPLVPVPFNLIPRNGNWSLFAPQIWSDVGDVRWPTLNSFATFDTFACRVGTEPC